MTADSSQRRSSKLVAAAAIVAALEVASFVLALIGLVTRTPLLSGVAISTLTLVLTAVLLAPAIVLLILARNVSRNGLTVAWVGGLALVAEFVGTVAVVAAGNLVG